MQAGGPGPPRGGDHDEDEEEEEEESPRRVKRCREAQILQTLVSGPLTVRQAVSTSRSLQVSSLPSIQEKPFQDKSEFSEKDFPSAESGAPGFAPPAPPPPPSVSRPTGCKEVASAGPSGYRSRRAGHALVGHALAGLALVGSSAPARSPRPVGGGRPCRGHNIMSHFSKRLVRYRERVPNRYYLCHIITHVT
ncbi:uncharacterized protein LOC127750793 [Frankliniella occidentalis]|uniref:Uncharacterized protein LOC127750793 n=1 Tax=Frankliniella occidentalis TaxID=133901 RepID=A0A9C6X508_FRAOC|nr:uncharacterized protein LOC127750793 [Frankliniella occidentalis]